ncbi:Mg-chelatase subunit ChlD [Herbihabitans rhizosphaerae]|uniref:Mg-chelatase subunit ChlD n=1 Tax=Herbihabitans rhizosphaerae TaxID=1872711 RepID=A0A4Q7L147_9PSEU|nr:substrate-binding domain-containing protein [Herbihabitans rhizosphaerae]RZS43218.1 Mg-chelatase subunit ChlD [Herbihabitans rhizosphaerae]
MGRHRAQGEPARRGVAGWPIVAVSLVAVVLLGWLGWTWLQSAMDSRAADQPEGCPQGDLSLRVAVAPSVESAVKESAGRWNSQRNVVHDHCVTVDVNAVEPERALGGLTGKWDESQLGPRPQAWLPDSSFWTSRLSATNNALIGAAPESVAGSPVVLAVREEAASALNSGPTFRWSDVPELAAAPDGWSRFGHPEWGRFGLALPSPTTNPASGLALQGGMAGVSPWRNGPVTTATLTLPVVQEAMARLAAAQAANVPPTTRDALIQLGDSTGMAGLSYNAIPVAEVDLYRRNMGFDGKPPPASPLTAVVSKGPSPNADFPLVGLAGAGIEPTHIRAAQRFRDFLKEPDQQREFAKAGLRGKDQNDRPSPSPGLRWDAPASNLVPADPQATQQLVTAWSNATGGGQVVTVLVDVSKSMEQDGGDGKSRMEWVKQALHQLADWTASGSVGLWEFSRALQGEEPFRQLVPTRPVADYRSALHTGVNGLNPVSATHLNASIMAVYRSATNNYVDGKTNRVVVITDGPNDGTPGDPQLLAALRSAADPARKVSVSIVALGPSPDRNALRKITEQTGGSLAEIIEAKGVDATLAQVLSGAG